jgi:hypothetical protein
MPTTTKKSQSISFSQTAEDKALLEAIEQAMAKQRYASFNELGKAALRQFLLTNEPTSSSPNAQQSDQQFTLLQQQLARLEQAFTTKESPQSSQMENQLARLMEQIELLGDKVTQPLAELQNQLTRLNQMINDQGASQTNEFETQVNRLALQIERLEVAASRMPTPEPEEPDTVQARELDPVVRRLSTLLENF